MAAILKLSFYTANKHTSKIIEYLPTPIYNNSTYFDHYTHL